MTDLSEEENRVTPVEQEQDQHPQEEVPKPPKMSETLENQPQEIKKPEKMNISFSIWPPTQRTRDAVINRLIETLSASSVLSKRYGTLPPDEALSAASRVEDEAFAAASGSASTDDDGIEILQVYSKEISKRMLEAVKSRSASASTHDNNNAVASESPAEGPTTTPSEDISSAETES